METKPWKERGSWKKGHVCLYELAIYFGQT